MTIASLDGSIMRAPGGPAEWQVAAVPAAQLCPATGLNGSLLSISPLEYRAIQIAPKLVTDGKKYDN